MHRTTHSKLFIKAPGKDAIERRLPTGSTRAQGRAIAILRDMPVGTEASLVLDGNNEKAAVDFYFDVVAERSVTCRSAT